MGGLGKAVWAGRERAELLWRVMKHLPNREPRNNPNSRTCVKIDILMNNVMAGGATCDIAR